MGTKMAKASYKPTSISKIVKISLVTSLATVSVPLWFFKIEYPLATFLKFDLVGIPYAIASLISIHLALALTPVLFIIFLYFSPDVIAISMKIFAEISTGIPLALSYKKFEKKIDQNKASLIAFAIAMVSRVAVMNIFNYLVSPYWIMWTYKWSFEAAYKWTVSFLLPVVSGFNAICVAYIAPTSLAIYRIIKRLGIE
jgi:riboflavin transporter FmnP